ncbi:MAG: prolyl oligopeptidase family serine peptidase [Bacteroidota bacterium]
MQTKVILISLIISSLIMNNKLKGQVENLNYPETKKQDVTDTYFGTKVSDPYRWLENDTADAVKEWVEQQNDVTFNYLESIPFKEKMKDYLTHIWNYEKFSAPSKKAGKYFYFKNDGLQNQSVLYMKQSADDDAQIILDPNKFSKDGTVALSKTSISKDGSYLAYGISKGGSDWNEFFIMDLENNSRMKDHLKWIKFSGIAWKDNGFYYSRYEKPEGSKLSSSNQYHKLYYHAIGDPQSQDRLIYENKEEPNRNYTAATTEDERFLILYESAASQGNALYYKDLNKKDDKFHKLADGFDHQYGVVDHIDGKFLVKTNYEAPKYRLVLIDPEKPSPKNWQDILPETDHVLEMVTLAGNRIIAGYMVDACSMLQVYSMSGSMIEEIALPGVGTVGSFNANKGDNEAYFTFSSYNMPSAIYQYDVKQNKASLYRKPKVNFNTEELVTRQIFYKSNDGTKIPMFLTHKKGLKMDGSNPVYLYGYGGFNVSLTPGFRITMVPFLNNGGIYAVPNLRGGGEYGEEWHQAGTKMNKQNVFDDFISAAEYLIDEGYTSQERIAIAGGSNGGLLVGACMTQRPDLFQVALPAVGVMDMLRYHKFTIGWHWAGDYGSSEESEEMFQYLLEYSPLHNITEDKEYPATLVTTADHDDRVVPAHSFKFIATLQEKQQGENPVLIRIETKAGHGAGKPTEKIIEETADVLSFLFYNMDITPDF